MAILPIGRLGGPRIHDWEAARRATWLELFFDLVFVVAVACGVAVQLSAEQAAHARPAVPLLGIGVAGVIAGFLLVSSGIGLHGRPLVIAAKLALAVGAVAVTAGGVDAASGGG